MAIPGLAILRHVMFPEGVFVGSRWGYRFHHPEGKEGHWEKSHDTGFSIPSSESRTEANLRQLAPETPTGE